MGVGGERAVWGAADDGGGASDFVADAIEHHALYAFYGRIRPFVIIGGDGDAFVEVGFYF
jgi:hypothetical protein